MDKDLRASLVAAGSAAALSALVGLIAGVGFFTLLLRALFGALLIGAAVYGGILLLRNMLPGLLSAPEADEDFDPLRSDEPEKGANIDIVLPGEAVTSEAFAGVDETHGYGPIDRSDLMARSAPLGRGPAESFLDEEASELSPVEDASLLDADGIEHEGPPAIPSGAGPEKGRRSSAGFDDLDVLPDLEGFSDSFTASEFASGGSSASGSKPAGYGGGMAAMASNGPRSGQEGLDPAALAQAVRTILKRDQKG